MSLVATRPGPGLDIVGVYRISRGLGERLAFCLSRVGVGALCSGQMLEWRQSVRRQLTWDGVWRSYESTKQAFIEKFVPLTLEKQCLLLDTIFILGETLSYQNEYGTTKLTREITTLDAFKQCVKTHLS